MKLEESLFRLVFVYQGIYAIMSNHLFYERVANGRLQSAQWVKLQHPVSQASAEVSTAHNSVHCVYYLHKSR